MRQKELNIIETGSRIHWDAYDRKHQRNTQLDSIISIKQEEIEEKPLKNYKFSGKTVTDQ